MRKLIISVVALFATSVVQAQPISAADTQRALENLVAQQNSFGLYGDVSPGETLGSVLAAFMPFAAKNPQNSCDLNLKNDWPMLFCKLSMDSNAGSISIDYSFNTSYSKGKIGDLSPADATVSRGAH